jgi:site-specific recombinase XerD
LNEQMDDFLLYLKVEKNLAPRTLEEYKMDIQLLADYLTQRHRIGEWQQVEYRELRYFLHYLQEERRNSATTRARKVSSLKGFFTFLHEEGYLSHNPALRLRKPKLEKKLPFYLSLEDCQHFIQVLKEHSKHQARDVTIMYLFLYTGIRLTELIGLDVSHVDLSNQTLRVYGKGRKERLLPILPPLASQLEEYLSYRKEQLGDSFSSFSPLFFTRRKKAWQRMHKRTVHEIFMRYSPMARTDQKHFSAHKLRHTFATLLHFQGVSLIELKDLLGHDSLSTTEIYTHTSPIKLHEAINRLPSFDQDRKKES